VERQRGTRRAAAASVEAADAREEEMQLCIVGEDKAGEEERIRIGGDYFFNLVGWQGIHGMLNVRF
jgi:hypothetical protein